MVDLRSITLPISFFLSIENYYAIIIKEDLIIYLGVVLVHYLPCFYKHLCNFDWNGNFTRIVNDQRRQLNKIKLGNY